MKRFIKIALILLFILLLSFTVYVNRLGPNLSAEALATIEEVIQDELPELLRGQTGYTHNNKIRIWYESLLPTDTIKGTILLNMGIANDALAWPDYFINRLLAEGYQVIRYDHRGTGLSDWLEDWSPEQAYRLEDMAADGIAVLDQLQVDKAHVIGISMGGMIAQEMALHFPDRVQSLSLLSTSAHIEDSELPSISIDLMKHLALLHLKYGLIPTERNQIKFHLSTRHLLMGDSIVSIDYRAIARQVLYNIRNRDGYNTRVAKQHATAVSLSGSRYEDLKQLSIPCLVVHGTSDPLIPIAHGQKCAEAIPGVQRLWLEGMGHDVPEAYNHRVTAAILRLLKD